MPHPVVLPGVADRFGTAVILSFPRQLSPLMPALSASRALLKCPELVNCNELDVKSTWPHLPAGAPTCEFVLLSAVIVMCSHTMPLRLLQLEGLRGRR